MGALFSGFSRTADGSILFGLDPGLCDPFPAIGLDQGPDTDPEDEQHACARQDGEQELDHPASLGAGPDLPPGAGRQGLANHDRPP